MPDDSPMQACDYLYAMRAGLNDPAYWSDGTWEEKRVRTKLARDERGRIVGTTGEEYTVTRRCLMGELGAVCEGSGTAYAYGSLPEYGTPAWNAMRLLALGIDESADEKAEDQYRHGLSISQGYDGMTAERLARRRASDVYAGIIMQYNDSGSRKEVLKEDYQTDYDVGQRPKGLKKKRHKRILDKIEKALQICFAEAKGKKHQPTE